MMEEEFRLLIDPLRSGVVERFSRELSPHFLEVGESDLAFFSPVLVSGEVYILGRELILQISVETLARQPCAICNATVEVPIRLSSLYEAVPLEEIRTPFFSLKEILREAILLEVKPVVECGGDCVVRKEIEPYLKKRDARDLEGDGELEEHGMRRPSPFDNC